jgi:hypothetical protein
MAEAFNAIKTVRDYPGGPLRATFSTTLDAFVAGSWTVTLTGTSGQNRYVPEPVEIVPARPDDTVFSFPDIVPGRDDFTSGQYDVHTYALVYRDIHTQNGKVVSELH